MRMRFAWISEPNFLTCAMHQVYGSKKKRIKSWRRGDYLAYCVDNKIAGLAEIVGGLCSPEELFWVNKVNQYVIPVKLIHLVCEQYRLPLSGAIEHVLTMAWGENYEMSIIANRILPETAAKFIYKMIFSTRNDLKYINSHIDELFDLC